MPNTNDEQMNILETPASPVVAGPKEYIHAVKESAQGLPVGDGWTINMVNPKSWKNPSAPSNGRSNGHSPYAYSDLENRVTHLRTDAMMLPPGVLRKVLAHEMGHLTLNTLDEDKANSWANTFLNPSANKVK